MTAATLNRRQSNERLFDVARRWFLEIVGYASSKEFDGVTQEESDKLNVEAANRRAWDKDGFRKMAEARPLDDRPPGIPKDERDPEELNRRVDFHVMHAGACQKPAALAPQVVAAAR